MPYTRPIMKVGLDMDGVLCDFTNGFTRLAVEMGVVKEPHMTSQQQAYEYPFDAQKVWNYLNTKRNWWATLDPLLSHDELDMLASLIKFHDVHIITNRKDMRVGAPAKDQVRFWLHSLGLRGDLVDIHTGMHRGEKGSVAASLGIDIAIDDHVENLLDYRASNVPAVCRTWQYNAEWDGPRVDSFADFVEYIENPPRYVITPAGENALRELGDPAAHPPIVLRPQDSSTFVRSGGRYA